MIERLQRALAHLEELPNDVQELLAEQIEDLIDTDEIANEYFGGSMPDIPDDAEEEILRMRHEVPPSKLVNIWSDV